MYSPYSLSVSDTLLFLEHKHANCGDFIWCSNTPSAVLPLLSNPPPPRLTFLKEVEIHLCAPTP